MKKLTMADLQSYKNFQNDLSAIKDWENTYDLRVKRGLSQETCEIFYEAFDSLRLPQNTDENWLDVANGLLESLEIYEDGLALDYDF